ncbi:MAG: branched-chain alpha-keto acid dehydrogenase subunit E2 [Edafosvirus sp.]|uniref:Branched-chain alpha-keto acid dehydrogenase subunit E2 n=1 Tax=Edafosvirus sp. TaxID=2487765 RepID=A0A3G4ZX12_9VIRU|nr:MAG: branched-chain alpha-keto acid dehydrogenase subunit E2 [Edafosvirus sp.]
MLRRAVVALANSYKAIPRRTFATRTILMPSLGGDCKSVNIAVIYYACGDTIKKNKSVMCVETDKVAVDLPCPVKGILKELHVKEGDKKIPIGAKLYTIDDTITN